MRPSQIRILDCRAGAPTSTGRPRGGGPGPERGAGGCPSVREAEAEAVAETASCPALHGLGNKAAVASVG